jgi:hypothetical protein
VTLLFLDGVYVGGVAFHGVRAPTRTELTALTRCIASRVARFLERQGLLEQDAENIYLAGEVVDEDPMAALRWSTTIILAGRALPPSALG